MGRPKKGEPSYRKPMKKNGIKQVSRALYDKPTHEMTRLSISSELDQEEEVLSNSADIFDPVSATQDHQLQQDNQQLNSHVQHLHHQQSGTFNLGSILHDCMTVRDWDQKVEMPDLDQGVVSSSATVTTSSSSGSGHIMMEGGGKISPHIKHSNPIMLSDMLGKHLQQQQLQHHHHHQQKQQQVKVLEQLHGDLQLRHQIVAYQEHNSNTATSVVSGLEYSKEHNFPITKVIKEENMSHRVGPGNAYTGDAVLGNVQNLQTPNKVDFQTYQMQGLGRTSQYSERAAASTPTRGTMLLPVSQIESGASSQLVSINMSSQGVLYTGHQHQEPNIIGSMRHHQQTIELARQKNLEQSNMDQESPQGDPNTDHNQGMEITDVSDGCHQVVTDQGILRVVQSPHILTSHSHINNMSASPRNTFSQVYRNAQHQFASESSRILPNNSTLLGSESFRFTNRGIENDGNFTVLSFGGQHNTTHVPSSLVNSSDAPVRSHHKTSEIGSPIAALLQQHRDAIHTGRPVQLSSEEVEELLNSVSAKQQRTQGFHINEHFISIGQKVESSHNSVSFKRQPTDSFVVKNEQTQAEEFGLCNRQTPPNSTRDYQGSSQSSRYHNSNPISQSITEVYRRQYHNQTPPCSESSSGDRRELCTGYSNATSINNNTSIINNNNNNNHVSHYIFHDTYNNQNNQNGLHDEVYEDSFNSALIRDSTQLHEINRIFLGIDNSCDTYACNHPNSSIRDEREDGEITALHLSPDEFLPENSHRYWHSFQPSQQFIHMTPERQKIIQDVLDAFDNLQKTYVTNEPEYINKTSTDQLDHWHHIQRRIARHVVAGQRFCRNIPGYFKLDIQDRISLGKHVGFGLMVLIACTEFYDPEFKRFKHIWNWTMPMQNPLFSYKVHLLSLGDRIHDIQVDRTEASMMCAISMTSIDCPNLLKPEIVCVVRDGLIDALKAHILTKTESAARLKKLMSIMPQVRLMTVWYNNLMKKMSLPSEVINGKISKPKVMEADGSENTQNIS